MDFDFPWQARHTETVQPVEALRSLPADTYCLKRALHSASNVQNSFRPQSNFNILTDLLLSVSFKARTLQQIGQLPVGGVRHPVI